MNFSSVLFVFYFLPLAVIGSFLLGKSRNTLLQNLFLILISLIFYGWADLKMILFILMISLYLYVFGIILVRKKSRIVLTAGVIGLIVMLSVTKYTNFVIQNLNRFLKMAIQPVEIIVPLGISFIIFESITYLVDTYKGEERGSFLDVLLFVSFFPKVTSGPIVSWKRFRPQTAGREISAEAVADGLEMFIRGLAKKVLVADILGSTVYYITTRFVSNTIDAASACLSALCYMVQIYYDFSGYSDMAIGISRMFGFSFEKNFDEPYRSRSITEFWRRWHISLGTWFREYVYIPLGGNRKHVYLNLFVVFLLTGIWHGAGWNYVLWGIMNGIVILLERRYMKSEWYQKIPSICRQVFVLAFVNFSWILFSFESLGSIKWFLLVMLGVNRHQFVNFTFDYYFNRRILVILVFAVLNDLIIPSEWKEKADGWMKQHLYVRYLLDILLFVITVIFMVNSTYSPFIYYKF